MESAVDLPDGPVADLACGASGTALLAAAHGRRVTAVDVSEVALGMLGAEAAPDEFARFPPRLSFSEGEALFRFVEGL